MNFEHLPQYELVDSHWMKELDSQGTLLRHKKSGAHIFLIENKDDNKVFNIGFRTPPSDSTGVPHIIEHTVLCGSDKYPAHDPFMELVKGSLNTFLNAMTYPDKTVYPVASTNDKDFRNLMSVYMDAVFHPNITKTDMIFRQEGWHYELESEDAELVYNGVVYNEMKGAFSSADEVLGRCTKQVLYPDTPYAFESGGDPECIPRLTYEDYLAFYHRYYHPSNSYIYLYGDLDMEKTLLWMDEEYLSRYDRIDPDSEIPLQKPFEKPAELTISYSVTEDEEEAGYYYSWNRVIGTSLDKKLYLAFQILEYALLSAPGAPLKQALLDAGIGRDIYGGYEEELQQPSFNVTAKDAGEDDKERFIEVIENTLRKIADEGINRRSLLAAVNGIEFKLRESDFGRWPKGLMIGLQCFDSWLYDENDPFAHLEYADTLTFLREQIDTGYYEELVKKYLIDNQFGALITARPEPGLTERQDARTKQELQKFRDTLTDEQLRSLVRDTKALREYQETPTPQEILEKIPMLEISDIRREAAPLFNEERELDGTKILFHSMLTSQIAYLEPVFCVDFMKPEELVYLALLKGLLGSVGTQRYSYQELSDEINIWTGGIASGFFILHKEQEAPRIYFSVRVKALYENLPKAIELMGEMMLHSDFTDDKRIREILGEGCSRMKEALQSGGNLTAVKRAGSYYSEAGYLNELTSGISYYRFIDELYHNYDAKKDEMRAKLQETANKLFTRSNLLVSYTADEEGYRLLEKPLTAWKQELGEIRPAPVKLDVEPEKKNEGFCCASQIQFVARAGNFRQAGLPYTGALNVLQNILNYDYLWKNLREKGGAYGCMCGFGRDGDSYFVSYLDPHLIRTNQVYDKLPEFVRGFTASRRDMTKFVIGAISEADVPMNPAAKGVRGLRAYLGGITFEQLQRERNEMLDADVEDIRALAGHMEAILAQNCVCVVGNESKLKENEAFFGSLQQL